MKLKKGLVHLRCGPATMTIKEAAFMMCEQCNCVSFVVCQFAGQNHLHYECANPKCRAVYCEGPECEAEGPMRN